MKLNFCEGKKGMLLQFRFKNYKSFVEETVLDMTATSIREHTNSLICVEGNKVLPVAAIYGANASGKSNFFEAFNAMREEVKGRANDDNKHNRIRSYLFDEKLRKAPSEFEICYSIEDKEYRYGFVRDQEKVYEEWLFENKLKKGTRAKEKCVYYRNGKKLETEVKNQKEKKEIEFVFSMLNERELMLTLLGKRQKSKYSIVYMCLQVEINCIDCSNDIDEGINYEMSTGFLYDSKEIFEMVKQILKKFDPDILDLTIEKETNGAIEDEIVLYSYHLDSLGNPIKTKFSMESSGTKKLFALSVWMIIVLEEGGLFFADELDVKLHPLVLRYIIHLFTNPETNKGHGQLIFSAHNLVCLDSADLRRDEIWFVEKNKQQSTMYSLYDFKADDSSVRSDMNFGKNYLSGRFGAVPFQERED